MGVDFFACSQCRATFPDCGPCMDCESCNAKLCPMCMNQFDLSAHKNTTNLLALDGPESEPDDEWQQCPFCAGLVVSEESLLDYALEKLGVSIVVADPTDRDAVDDVFAGLVGESLVVVCMVDPR